MKILIKSSKASKLYTQEVTFAGLQKFIAKEFPEASNWSLTFTDPDGDNIIVVSDADLQVMKEIIGEKEYVKMVLSCEGETP